MTWPASRPRLFILGLDGSPLSLLRDLMAAGDLPNLARLFEQGSAVPMSSSLPDVSAVAWTSINTGKNPGKHGIYGFFDRTLTGASMRMELMTARHVRSRAVWELVSDAGGRAVALNVPLSYPPQHINGVVVSDFLAPALSKAVYPPSLLPALESIGYRIDTDPRLARQSLDAFLDDFRITAEKRAEAVLHLMRSEAWNLFMVVFMETDRLHHFLWGHMAENHPVYARRFVEAYRQIDSLAGRIIAQLSPDDGLIVLSDHGFTSLKKEVYLNVWLEQEGYMRFNPGAERGVESIAPSTRCYSLDPGRVYVNLTGREPTGTVSIDDAPALLDEVAAGIEALTDPEDGSPIVERVYRGIDVYSGPEAGRAPDLVVMPHDGYDIKGSFDATTLTGKGPLVGMHKYHDATLFVRGHRFHTDNASVRDVLPTACTILGMPCPPDVDGRVIVEPA